jgi:hypothetical protein
VLTWFDGVFSGKQREHEAAVRSQWQEDTVLVESLCAELFEKRSADMESAWKSCSTETSHWLTRQLSHVEGFESPPVCALGDWTGDAQAVVELVTRKTQQFISPRYFSNLQAFVVSECSQRGRIVAQRAADVSTSDLEVCLGHLLQVVVGQLRSAATVGFNLALLRRLLMVHRRQCWTTSIERVFIVCWLSGSLVTLGPPL